jgi:anhydro-N-acetylmuramic acid kinase
LARSGNCNQELLKQLNAIDFYSKSYPKSLGMEFVNALVFPMIESFKIPTEDKLNTFVEHIAFQINKVCSEENSSLLITGGGVYNKFLIERIQFYLKTTKIIIPDDKTIQFKEALLFGFLGVLRLRNEINVLASVTGAKENHSSGVVFN